MKRLLRFIACGVILATSFIMLRWTDPLRFAVMSCVLPLSVAVWWLVHRLRTRGQSRVVRQHAATIQPLRDLIVGVAQGAALSATIAGVIVLVERIPGIDPLRYDSDRNQVEAILQVLEDKHDWRDAAEQLEKRLRRPVSDSWQIDLINRLYRSYCHAADENHDTECVAWLEKAQALAVKYNIEPQLVTVIQARNAAIEKALATESDLNRLAARMEQQTTAQSRTIDQLNIELAAMSDAVRKVHDRLDQIDAQTAAEALEIFRPFLIDDRIAAPFRQTLVEAGLAFGERHHAATNRMTELAKAIEAQTQQLLPATLPPNVKIELLGSRLDLLPPVVIFDLSVRDSAGHPISGLARKDFAVERSGHWQNNLAVSEVRPTTEPMHIAILFDTSGSTAGTAIQAAKRGAIQLVESLSSDNQVKLIPFATTVTDVADWTTNRLELANRINAVKAEGNTALLRAIERAIGILKDRPGRRRIVIFTDGADTVGGPSAESLVAACRQSRISIDTIGLAGANLDAKLLQTFATQTGGTFVSADDAGHLAAKFTAEARFFQQTVYRLVIPADNRDPISLRIGGGNAIEIRLPTQPSVGDDLLSQSPRP